MSGSYNNITNQVRRKEERGRRRREGEKNKQITS